MNKKKFLILSMVIIIGILMLQIQKIEALKTWIYTFVTTDNSYAQIIRNGSEEEKMIALTFDDGPHPRFTPQILDLLKKYDAKATFFVLGKHVELYPEVLKREILEGHEVGNHTFTHIDVKKTAEGKIREEFEKTQEAVYSVAGIKPKLFRPPFGFYNEKVLDIAKQNECRIILWSGHQDSKDWCNPGTQKIVKKTLSEVRNGDIVLFHDYVEGPSQTIEALKIILPELKNRGYEFVTISRLLELSTIK